MKRVEIENRQWSCEDSQQPYDTFEEIYVRTIVPLLDEYFEALENEQEHFMWEEQMETSFTDEATKQEFAKQIFENFEEKHKIWLLGLYNVRLMWIATMYQFWEQQVRKFLYDEIYGKKDKKEVEFKDFCIEGIKDFKKEFKKLDCNITKMDSWLDINELRMLTNVIKHGEGSSSTNLKKKSADLFDGKKMELHRTILNERVLKIPDSHFTKYKSAIQKFWEEISEGFSVKR